MIDRLLSTIAPHYCCGCAKSGTLLCDNCKYDIINEPFEGCIACGKNIVSINGICTACQVPYGRAWCVGERHEALKTLIDGYKFYNTKAAQYPLAVLLHEHLPELPPQTIIVPVPTVADHIRQRGYDHMLLIAKQLAQARRLPYKTMLERVTATKQRDAGRRLRIEQAKKAFDCRSPLDPEMVYLLIDDVVTTGATLKYAVKTLQKAGATEVWVASISRQALD